MVEIKSLKEYGAFIAPEHLPKGKDEYYLRNAQNPKPKGFWRALTAAEIKALEENSCVCADWSLVLVADPFTPAQVRGCTFSGLVRIGKVEKVALRYHDLELPAGLSNSLIVSCDIGDNCALHNVSFLSHYIIGDGCILLNVGEMQTTDHAKFGNGIVKDGEQEDVRIWLEVMNEVGTRSVLPFSGMIPADAALWATHREDTVLQEKLLALTQSRYDSRRGWYGQIGHNCVIKHTRIIKDAEIGPHSYIKGANKLKNITIMSTQEEPSQIGEGVECVNGIVGAGSAIFYGAKAVRFVIGPHCKLKYGARLINSFLGDNSTVSCCEMLNNLIFPAHEQHHNNSFLTASLLMGQTNLAAAVTAGSNHNSRANDGEIRAGRGFWPGLATTLKHSCRFASFSLLVKGDYPAELNIQLPFSLVSNDASADKLLVMPAFWWMYNMYALARNTWKYGARDHRAVKAQKIEFDYLAPDTVEEMFQARRLLETWTGRASLGAKANEAEAIAAGRKLLRRDGRDAAGLEVRGEGMEHTKRPCIIQKPFQGYRAYRDMILLYAVKNLMEWCEENPKADSAAMAAELAGPRENGWVNLGGQLMREADAAALREDVKSGRLSSWDAVHARYDQLWARYPADKRRHAFASLLDILERDTLGRADWEACLEEAVKLQGFISDQVYLTRKKDFENPFRQATFESQAEMDAVDGVLEKNSFVVKTREDTGKFAARAQALIAREG